MKSALESTCSILIPQIWSKILASMNMTLCMMVTTWTQKLEWLSMALIFLCFKHWTWYYKCNHFLHLDCLSIFIFSSINKLQNVKRDLDSIDSNIRLFSMMSSQYSQGGTYKRHLDTKLRIDYWGNELFIQVHLYKIQILFKVR